MSTEKSTNSSRRSALLEFLGSMNLAISLLVVVAMASVIGTVLQQNQPYNGYREQFGPFWFELFRSFGLYDIYSSLWFLAILGFLVASTGVCIWRNAPVMLREMQNWRLNVKRKSLKLFHHHDEWQSGKNSEQLVPAAAASIEQQGYKVRVKRHDDHVVVAGVRGSWNRYGYLFTHISIIVICLGGLLDGNIGMRIKEWKGDLVVQKEDMRVDQVPAKSRLKPGDSIAFRGNRSIPEGELINVVTLNVRDGYVIQELPFAIKVEAFRVTYYSTGQPKSFESDLVIIDGQKQFKKTIRVNHPLIYRGYAIYQSSFGDGGSKLTFSAWPLMTGEQGPDKVLSAGKYTVFNAYPLNTPKGKMILEVTAFRANNIFPFEDASKVGGKRFEQWGPSVTYKLRDDKGVANEYVNYMIPRLRNGRRFYLAGVRKSVEAQFNFWHIPVSPKGGIGRFMNFRALLFNKPYMQKLVRAYTEQVYGGPEKIGKKKFSERQQLNHIVLRHFLSGKLDMVMQRMKQQVSPEQYERATRFYRQILSDVLLIAYEDVLRKEGVDVSKGVSGKQDRDFFVDAFTAMSAIGKYDAPFLFQMKDFRQINATGLQVTRSPGTKWVYLGCLMLIAGVFIMFYVHHRRLWIVLTDTDNGCEVILAGMGNRNLLDFAKEYDAMSGDIRNQVQ